MYTNTPRSVVAIRVCPTEYLLEPKRFKILCWRHIVLSKVQRNDTSRNLSPPFGETLLYYNLRTATWDNLLDVSMRSRVIRQFIMNFTWIKITAGFSSCFILSPWLFIMWYQCTVGLRVAYLSALVWLPPGLRFIAAANGIPIYYCLSAAWVAWYCTVLL